jgi:hypothetical protein
LISTLVARGWLASRPGRFIPGERAPGVQWMGVWVGARAGLDDMEKKILAPPGLKLRPLDRPTRSQSLYRLRYPGSCTSVIPLQKYVVYITNSIEPSPF